MTTKEIQENYNINIDELLNLLRDLASIEYEKSKNKDWITLCNHSFNKDVLDDCKIYFQNLKE